MAVLLLAGGLRLLGLQEQSLSMDELDELSIGRRTFSGILRAQDGFPPLYHSLLHFWFGLCPSDACARWLSAILGTLGVGAVWGFARRIGGDAVGLWTAVLVAVSPFQIWHSQEGRAYVLYYLLAAAGFWSFFTALQTDTRRAWTAYVVIAWAGLATHYHFSLLILANVAILAFERGQGISRRSLAAHAALAFLSLPLLWFLRNDLLAEAAAPYPTNFHPAAVGYTLFSFLSGYAIGPSPRALHGLAAGAAIQGVLPWLLLTGCAAGILLYQGLRELGPRLWTQRLLIISILPIVVSVAAAGILSVTFQVRHLLWASIPLMAVVGAGASRWKGRPLVAVSIAGLLLVFGVSRYNRLEVPDYQNEDVRGLAAFLRTQGPGAPVLLSTGYMAAPVRHYLGDEWTVMPVPGESAQGRELEDALRYVDSTAGKAGRFWLVYTREFHGDPQGRLLQALSSRRAVRLRARFAGIVLYAGEVPAGASR